MTKNTYIPPMTNKRRVIFIVYEGFELLDLSGPSAVFSTANKLANESIYEIITSSPRGGAVRASCGLVIHTAALEQLRFRSKDTLLAMGAYRDALIAALNEKTIITALRRASLQCERYGSVCVGTFLLAKAGLLSRKRAVTHWNACQALSQHYPDIEVNADALYINHGRLWTSAGVTTGIDMALAMLSNDHGAKLMGMVAKQLVVYARRPGHQSQFSSLLEAQIAADGMFSELIAWLEENLDKPIKVADMAARMAMSERSFFRKFCEVVGVGPAKFLERLRVDRAKSYLEAGKALKLISTCVGFRSESAFRSAYAQRYGVTPGHHQRMQR
jgi:transcriptional regulator GlxA family with amidase domain